MDSFSNASFTVVKRYLATFVAISVMYCTSGWLGLQLAVPPGYATAVFPASGFALAALLLCGKRHWPAVLIGSMAMNLLISAGDMSLKGTILSMCIGAGAAAQAYLGRYLLVRNVGSSNTFSNVKSVGAFILWGTVASTIVSATVGSSSLYFFEFLEADAFFTTWWYWWVGDSIGVMIFCPLILIWFNKGGSYSTFQKAYVTGVAATLFLLFTLIHVAASKNQVEKISSEFSAFADEKARLLQFEIDIHKSYLSNLAQSFVIKPDMSRSDFNRLATPHIQNHSTIRAIGWDPYIQSYGELLNLEKKAHAEGFPEFEVRELGSDGKFVRVARRSAYVPIFYLEPMKGNEPALGFDLNSNAERSKTISKAVESGKISSSSVIQLVQDGKKQGAFIVFIPINQYGSINDSDSESRDTVTGFISAVFVIKDLLQAAMRTNRPANSCVYMQEESGEHISLPIGFSPPQNEIKEGHSRSFKIDVGQRHWNVTFAPTEKFVRNRQGILPWLVLACGMLFIGLLQSFLLASIGRRIELEGLVSDRTADLEFKNLALDNALKSASQASEAKDQFLANMSHEIRTPMNAVIGMTGLVLESKCLSEDDRAKLETIQTSGDALLELINDVLDYSKVQAGKMKLDLHPVDLPALILETVALMNAQANERGLALESRVEAEVPHYIRTDSARVRQVLLNYLSNAVKFTQSGSVSVRVQRPSNSQVENRSGSHEVIKVSVVDTGPGIPKNELDRIYEQFTQLETEIEGSTKGTGLGLAISAQIIELLGGRTGVESVEKRGSTFWFEIPAEIIKSSDTEVKRRERDQIEESELQENKNYSGLRVLVVEDDQVNQTISKHILSNLGASVDVANDGLEALDLASSLPYDVVFMDCQMPNMDGFDATKEIRSREVDKDARVPIIALTAYATEGIEDKCLSVGMDDYMSKPVRPVDFIEKIDHWFYSRPPRQRLSTTILTKVPINLENQLAGSFELVEGDDSKSLEALVDKANLDELCAGNEDLKAEMIKLYVSTSDDRLESIKKAIDRGDFSEVGKLAHALKGSSSQAGATGMQKIAKELEVECKGKVERGRIEELYSKLISIFADTKTIFESTDD